MMCTLVKGLTPQKCKCIAGSFIAVCNLHMCGGWQKITWRVRDIGELNMGLGISGDAS